MPQRSPSREVRQLVRMFLIEDSAVNAVVGGRVYGRALEDAEAETVLLEGPVLVFELVAGSTDDSGHVQLAAMELYGYSKRSQDQAADAYDVAFDALHEARLYQDGINTRGMLRETQRPRDGYNHVLAAWFCQGRWLIEAAS